MKDHEKAQLVNQLRDIAIEFHGAQQLRERIAQVVLAALERVERDMAHEAGAALAQVAPGLVEHGRVLGREDQVVASLLAHPREIDWGEVDDHLTHLMGRICDTARMEDSPARERYRQRQLDELRALLRKVSGQ